MSLKFDQDDENIMSEINMTPLIDIMLVLLIIFMVTSSVSLESGLDIDLPETNSTSEKSSENNVVIVSLSKDGSVSVQGKIIEEKNLQESISIALKEEKTTTIILEGDRASELGNAVQIMDIAKQAGALKFAIAAESSN